MYARQGPVTFFNEQNCGRTKDALLEAEKSTIIAFTTLTGNENVLLLILNEHSN